MNKLSKKKLIYPILTIVWMGFIFYMSSRNGEQSSGMSDTICYLIGMVFIKDFRFYPNEKKAHFISEISLYVRKMAHMAEYCLLMILVMNSFRAFDRKEKKYTALSLVICIFYAISDEAHQGYVGGRSPQIRDVCIDIVGSLTGEILLYLFFSSKEQKWNDAEKSQGM